MTDKVKSRNGERIYWEDHHMMLALITSQRSPDPNTQVGACIVKDNVVVGLGYNGLPRGMIHSTVNWARKNEDTLQTKYPFVVHAEKNAIFNATGDLAGSTLYVTLYPCNECAKDIIQAGIRRIVYLENPYADEWFTKAANQMFNHLDIGVEQHIWNTSRAKSCLDNLINKVTT